MASYFRGRIYGEGTGTTAMTAEYGGDAAAYSLTPTQIQETMNRANLMKHYIWKAEAKFRLNDGTYAEEGRQLEGMPYSKYNRCTLAEFIEAYTS